MKALEVQMFERKPIRIFPRQKIIKSEIEIDQETLSVVIMRFTENSVAIKSVLMLCIASHCIHWRNYQHAREAIWTMNILWEVDHSPSGEHPSICGTSRWRHTDWLLSFSVALIWLHSCFLHTEKGVFHRVIPILSRRTVWRKDSWSKCISRVSTINNRHFLPSEVCSMIVIVQARVVLIESDNGITNRHWLSLLESWL